MLIERTGANPYQPNAKNRRAFDIGSRNAAIRRCFAPSASDDDLRTDDAANEPSLLHAAALDGDSAAVAHALHSVDVDTLYRGGVTGLMMAARGGHQACARLLLEASASVNALSASACSPLTMAAEEGHEELVTLLIAHCADSCHADSHGLSALCRASENGHVNVVLALLEGKADLNYQGRYGTPLMLACRYDRVAVVDTLLTNGAEVDLRRSDGSNSLLYASLLGYTRVVELLLLASSDVNAATRLTGEVGTTSLMYAATSGHSDVLIQLLQAGATINLRRESDGRTALHLSCMCGQLNATATLLAWGGDVALLDETGGKSCLALAVEGPYVELLRLLLSYPNAAALLDLPDKQGAAPLHRACVLGDPQCAFELLKAGSTPQLPVARSVMGTDAGPLGLREGARPIDIARAYGHPAICEYLSGPTLSTAGAAAIAPALHRWLFRQLSREDQPRSCD
jgi:ankyrin repeat protein